MYVYRGIIAEAVRESGVSSNTINKSGNVGIGAYLVECPVLSAKNIQCEVLTLTGTIPHYEKGKVVYVTELGNSEWLILGTPYQGEDSNDTTRFMQTVTEEIQEIKENIRVLSSALTDMGK